MTLAKIAPVVFSREQVQSALHAFCPKMRAYELDGKYWCLTRAEWDAVIRAAGPEPHKYEADKFDCDAFSRVWYGRIAEQYEINGMLIVVDFSGEHSYNLLLEHDGQGGLSCCLFEPQTLTRPVKGAKPYTLTDGFML